MEVMFWRAESRQLTGRVDIDDAYLGGEVHGGKPGRGSPDKVAFVAAVQTSSLTRLAKAASIAEPCPRHAVRTAEQSC